MVMQFSAGVRNASLDAMETATGTGPTLEIRTGPPPANCAAADTGTPIATLTLPTDWMAAASAGAKALLGSWAAAAAASGTAGHFRIKQGATCHFQGSVSGPNVALTTNAVTAANSNVLNFASTAGVAVGQMISGPGIPAGAQVLALTATAVTMSLASTAGVASGASIAFGGDVVLQNASINVGQNVSITAFNLTAGGA
jgi:hypothetical protein